MDAAAARDLIRTRRDLEAEGLSSRQIAAAVRAGELVHLHRGAYVPAGTWARLYPESRHLVHVVAVHDRRRGSDAVNMLSSAAVLHGLPLFRLRPERVHLGGAASDGRVETGGLHVARHRIPVAEQDRTEVDGIPCTSLARTVADCARHLSEEAGIALADAALRRAAWSEEHREYDVDQAEVLRDEIWRCLAEAVGGRGVRRARYIVGIADGRAQLPGESVSRLYLLHLGFASPRLQVPIPAPHGGEYFVDFGLDDVDAWGEFDGEVKYADPALRGGRSTDEVVLAEKQREDWIRGTTNRRFPRWGMRDIASASTLRLRLAQFHVHPRFA